MVFIKIISDFWEVSIVTVPAVDPNTPPRRNVSTLVPFLIKTPAQTQATVPKPQAKFS